MRFQISAAVVAAGLLLHPVLGLANHEGHPHDAATGDTVVASTVDSPAAGETIRVKATGLVCDYCARAMEKVLLKRPEVAGLTVDLTSKVVEIRLKKGATMDDAAVRNAVEISGYGIQSIERL